MKTRSLVAAIVVLGMTLPQRAPAQQADTRKPGAQEVPTFGVGTAAVLLDVVVRDKKQKAIRDLTAADFEIFEDGVRQQVDQFRIVSHDAPPPAAASVTPSAPAQADAPSAPAPPAAPAAQENGAPVFIAFVFDRMSPTARDMAFKAGNTYLSTGRRPDDVVAVFNIDLALHTVQPFTRDLEQIKTAFDRVRTQGHTQFASELADTRKKLDGIAAVDTLEDSVSGTGGPGSEQISGSIGGAMAARQASQIQVQVNRAFESLERDQQGYATTNALMAVVSGLKQLPGRKTVVFFSEGMVIPANVQAQFRSVIHSANRANVAVYTVDAGGLHAESLTKEGREEMMQAMRRRMRQLESGRDDATGGAMTKAMERNEDLLRLNPEAGLGQLAQQTGGFLIRDTNDASEGFSRIEEDMRFHYILSYTPSNENYDGRFRQISVKVKRPGAAVHSRDGYFAVRPEGATPMLSYEAPALVQLDKSPRPSAFPLQVTGLSFPEAKRPGLVPVLVEVPGTAMTYAPDKENKQMQRADFAIVVRVKDGSQQTVDRMSQHYVLTAAPNQVANAQKGAVLFYRETDLQPGRYTIEAVGYDAVANKASVKTSTLDVPANRDGNLRISSLVLVKRIEDVPEKDKNPSNSNPLFYGQTLIYPNLGDPVRRSAQQMLSFYFTAYSDQAATAARRAAVEVRRGGQPVGQATMELPTPDSNGRIQHAGVLPIQSFTPGAYELKVTVADGRSLATTSAPFTVEE